MILFWLVTIISILNGLRCFSNDIKVVDWSFIYKINNAYTYAYYDSSTNLQRTLYVLPDNDLTTDSNALYYTLNQIWTKQDKYNYIAYNDEPPSDKSVSETYGHTKGVLAFDSDSNSGFWLIHSWPKFPDFSQDKYTTEPASIDYGQSYLCISITDYNTFNIISYQIRYMSPYVYASNNMFSDTNNFSMILDKEWLQETSIMKLNPYDKNVFTHFAKSRSWDNDLYEYLVSPALNTGFYWETWRRQEPEPSFCKPEYKYDSINVNYVKFNDGTTWKYTVDHSKIGTSMIDNWVCIGGINRMYTQYNRSGGTACFRFENFWYALNASFYQTDSC